MDNLGLAVGNYLTGGSDAREEGTWEWVTGEPWGYINWSSGEPNNCRENEHHLVIESTTWNDEDANSNKFKYICEWDYNSSIDCNDAEQTISPETLWYKDADNDGYTDGATKTQCLRPVGYKLASELSGSGWTAPTMMRPLSAPPRSGTRMPMMTAFPTA